MNGSYHDYLITKGIGSQDVYDAYYAKYGDSTVWAHILADTTSNIAVTRGGGTGTFKTTQDSIQEIVGQEKDNTLLLVVLALLSYNFIM